MVVFSSTCCDIIPYVRKFGKEFMLAYKGTSNPCIHDCDMGRIQHMVSHQYILCLYHNPVLHYTHQYLYTLAHHNHVNSIVPIPNIRIIMCICTIKHNLTVTSGLKTVCLNWSAAFSDSSWGIGKAYNRPHATQPSINECHHLLPAGCIMKCNYLNTDSFKT